MASVALKGVGKLYADGTRAVESLDLEIEDGEFVVLVGPSGCGKTTVLRMVGGLEGISEGELMIGDRVANRLGPRERDIAMVFQNYALYPHMSVYENIAFPLRAQRASRDEVKRRVESTAELLGLEKHLRRKPRHLSGGQRQRVAMGRALIRQPEVFLMDEPLSNLDANLRAQMRAEIINLQRELGVTTIYVTHDQVEAMTMGNRIAVLRDGVLQQQGPPQDLYRDPANLFVARFIGSPPMNFFRAAIELVDGRTICRLKEGELVLPDGYLDSRPALRKYEGREVAIGVRPEHLRDARSAPELPRLRGEALLVETLGAERQVHLRLPAAAVLTQEVLDVVRDFDAPAVEELATGAGERQALAIARFEADADVPVGEVIEVGLVAEKLRFFDLDSGAAIKAEGVGHA